MVTLTRLTGARFAMNPDLIERVDVTPDTVITLVDGTKYLVAESLDEVVAAVLGYRAEVLRTAGALEQVGEGTVRRARLSAVPAGEGAAQPMPAGLRDTDDTEDADAPVVPFGPRTP